MNKLTQHLPQVESFAMKYQVAAIKALFDTMSDDVRRHFDIRENYDFTIDPVVIELGDLY